MSDGVLQAAIGAVGTVVGAVAAITVARVQAAGKALPPTGDTTAGATALISQSVDIRELRILRALFGEPKGRALEAYKDAYYRGSLNALVGRGLVALVDGRYHLTVKGTDFCRGYVGELLLGWRPALQIHAAPSAAVDGGPPGVRRH